MLLGRLRLGGISFGARRSSGGSQVLRGHLGRREREVPSAKCTLALQRTYNEREKYMIARITRGSAHTALAISLASLPLAVSATAYAKDQVQPEPSADRKSVV